MKESTPVAPYNKFNYIPPKPLAVMHVDPGRITHLEIFKDHCRLTSGRWTSPSFNRDEVYDIVSLMSKVKSTPKDKFSFGREPVHFNGKDYHRHQVSVSTNNCQFGKVSIQGLEAFVALLSAFNCFYWGNYKNQMETVITDHGGVFTSVVGKDYFGDQDKFAWWEFKKRPELPHKVEFVDAFEMFQLEFEGTAFIYDLIKGIKATTNGAMEYKLTVPELRDINVRLFRFCLPDGRYAVGISTDRLMYAQRAFIFFGEESGKKFLTYLNDVKKVFL
ncbi:hypothetical protein PQD71_gp227 [Kosakonia phage Kc263]|uniref:Uncharacterized protein n=1 Tax=Kosakonia phage Kc263 TaxID=2863194 RepID=A0AAE7WFE3_9CAUD|nr:hypothetical protein PQD71_gp227 [Kosakonia phage Kc263]QYN80099.1 hypothetical protein [Kosakonia phage Kc263]